MYYINILLFCLLLIKHKTRLTTYFNIDVQQATNGHPCFPTQ